MFVFWMDLNSHFAPRGGERRVKKVEKVEG